MGLCGGPSSQEQALAQQGADLSKTMDAAMSERFSGQNDVLAQLHSDLSQLQSGQTPEGFASPELAAMTTSILNASAGASKQAQQAAGNFIAGQGGGAGSGITSGIQAQIRGSIASDIAGKQAAALGNLTQQDYLVGRENLEKSIAGLNTLSGQYDPTQYAKLAASTTQSAFGNADKIQQEKNQASAGLFGALGGIAKTALNLVPGVGPALSAGLGVLTGGKKSSGGFFGSDSSLFNPSGGNTPGGYVDEG